MHPKNPVGVLQIPNAVGLDAAIQQLTDKLQTVIWLDKVFGRAFTHPVGLGDKPKNLPFVYSGNGEYWEVTKNDYLTAQVFLRTEGPERYTEAEIGRRTGRTEAYRPLGLIVWVNLKELDFAYKSDYPYSENLKMDLMNRLRTTACVRSFDEYTDEPLEVFRGYDISKVDVRYLKYPYAAFKLTFTVKYYSPCLT